MKVVYLRSDGPPQRADYHAAASLSWEQVTLRSLVAFEEHYSPPDVEMQRAGYNAMELALDGHDFGIVTFDDVIVAPDVLEYFLWAECAFRDDPTVAVVTAFQLGSRDASEADFYQVEKSTIYTCGCWGTWSKDWETYFKPDYDFTYAHRGFDHQVRDLIFPAHGLHQVFPTWARAQNIGAVGAHMQPHMLAEHESHPYAGSLKPLNLKPIEAVWHFKGE